MSATTETIVESGSVDDNEKAKPGCLRCGENTECSGDDDCWCQTQLPAGVTTKPCNFCASCACPN